MGVKDSEVERNEKIKNILQVLDMLSTKVVENQHVKENYDSSDFVKQFTNYLENLSPRQIICEIVLRRQGYLSCLREFVEETKKTNSVQPAENNHDQKFKMEIGAVKLPIKNLPSINDGYAYPSRLENEIFYTLVRLLEQLLRNGHLKKMGISFDELLNDPENLSNLLLEKDCQKDLVAVNPSLSATRFFNTLDTSLLNKYISSKSKTTENDNSTIWRALVVIYSVDPLLIVSSSNAGLKDLFIEQKLDAKSQGAFEKSFQSVKRAIGINGNRGRSSNKIK